MSNLGQFTRRQFLNHSACAIGAAAAMPAFAGSAASDRILVLLHLAGGNDGLNTVIPIHSDDYYRARPRLAILRREALRIDERFGLHPAAAGLRQLHDAGQLAILHAVGYPMHDRSHARAARIMATGEIDATASTGWIGRYLDATGAKAATLTGDVPLALAGERSSPIALNARPEAPLAGDIAMAAPTSADSTAAAASTTDTAFAADLRRVAHSIASGNPARVYYLTLGGFDTHSGQASRHAQLLSMLGDGLAAFVADLRRSGQLHRTLLLAYSEFGRRVAENGSAGTDHGAATPMFLVGGGVTPGLHGRFPSLSPAALKDGNLPATTDFRDVYATVLNHWLSAGGSRDPLGLIRA